MSMYNGSETYLVKIVNVIAIPEKLSPRPIISCQNFSYHTRLHHRPPHFVRRICSQIGSFQGYLGNIDRDVVFEKSLSFGTDAHGIKMFFGRLIIALMHGNAHKCLNFVYWMCLEFSKNWTWPIWQQLLSSLIQFISENFFFLGNQIW